jgi:hypothetical protein
VCDACRAEELDLDLVRENLTWLREEYVALEARAETEQEWMYVRWYARQVRREEKREAYLEERHARAVAHLPND